MRPAAHSPNDSPGCARPRKEMPALARFADWGIPRMAEEKYKLKGGERPLVQRCFPQP